MAASASSWGSDTTIDRPTSASSAAYSEAGRASARQAMGAAPGQGRSPEVDPVDVDAELLGEQAGGGSRPAGDVEDHLTRSQLEGPGQAAGEGEPAGVVALPEEQCDRVRLIGGGTTGFEGLGSSGANEVRFGHRRPSPTLVLSRDAGRAPLPLPSATVFEP